ncbi:MAG TPA: DUF4290 domain-containing protein [Chitinophagaceae bacterium]|nr:DUF4290 domain-containing protein [Chitinophagaceae bacterium]
MPRAGCPVSINFSLNDLLGGRGWWLVKGALVRGPFLFANAVRNNHFESFFQLLNSFSTFVAVQQFFMEYNTTRNDLVMREYGRHVQKMIEHLLSIEDPERRQRNAQAVIELMGFLNPHLKNVEDFRHKLWDHLFLISDFKLNVKSPYPIPTRETLKARPEILPYPKRHPRYSHLGKNLELVIKKALQEENPDKRLGFANAVAYYMKLAYSNWHKEMVHDDAIQSELSNITDNQLTFTNTPFVKAFRPQQENRDRGGYGKQRGKFQQRGGGGRRNDNRNGGGYKKKRY